MPTPERGGSGLLQRFRGAHPSVWLQLLAIVPPLMILELVLSSSQLQWFDYWNILAKIIDTDGSLIPRNIVHFEESHVLAVPSFIYWANLELTGGLNRPLGYLDIAIVAATVLVLRSLLPARAQIGPWMVAALVVAISALLFSPQGAWNFSRAMSGTAWLTANLLAVGAIACAARGRIIPAIVLAGVASITYGTGLATWPALFVVLLLRGWQRRDWLVVAAAVVTVGIYLLFYDPSRTTASGGFAVGEILNRALQLIGSVLNPTAAVALLLGTVCVVTIAYVALRAIGDRELRRSAAPWLAVAAFAVISALLIGRSRGGIHGEEIAVTSRYASLAALAWSSMLVLLVLWLRPQPRVWLAVAVVAVLAFVAGQPTLTGMKDAALAQDELAIAMRLGVSTGYTFGPQDRFIPRYQAARQYPYNGDFDEDCGRLGTRLDRDSIQRPRGPTAGNLDRFEPALNPRSVRMTGWFGTEDGDVRCILIADQSMRVVGAGVPGHERSDLLTASPTGEFDLGFVAVAESGAREYRAFAVVAGRDGIYEVRGSLAPPEAVSESEPPTAPGR